MPERPGETAVAERTADDWLVCITQSPEEPAEPEYLAVCTVKADLLAESSRCVAAGCGGHPICRPCFDLGVERGLVVAYFGRQFQDGAP